MPDVIVTLSERDLNCIKWAGAFVQDLIEPEFPDLSGVREGEAMSDVLMAIVSRAERGTEVVPASYANRLIAEADELRREIERLRREQS